MHLTWLLKTLRILVMCLKGFISFNVFLLFRLLTTVLVFMCCFWCCHSHKKRKDSLETRAKLFEFYIASTFFKMTCADGKFIYEDDFDINILLSEHIHLLLRVAIKSYTEFFYKISKFQCT